MDDKQCPDSYCLEDKQCPYGANNSDFTAPETVSVESPHTTYPIHTSEWDEVVSPASPRAAAPNGAARVSPGEERDIFAAF